MDQHIYKIVELAGSSSESIEDAIRAAIGRAGKTIRNLRWFEVIQTRGHIEDGEIHPSLPGGRQMRIYPG